LGTGCSLERGGDDGKPFTIRLERDARVTSPSDLAGAFGIAEPSSPPAGIAAFSCFAVNATGPGIIPRNEDLHNCDIDSSYTRGFGRTSDSVHYDTPIELTIPSGPDRWIDVVGLIKGNGQSNCDKNQGSGGTSADPKTYGYLLGRVQRDLYESTTVTVPIAFATGQKPIIACEEDNSELVPSGTVNGNGSAVYLASSVSCQTVASGFPTDSSPANPPEATQAQYSLLNVTGGASALQASCMGTANPASMWIAFDLSQFGDLSRFSTATVDIGAGIGVNSASSTTCNLATNTAALSSGGGQLEIYKPSANAWSLVLAADAAHPSLVGTQSIGSPANFVVGNRIWFRLIGGAGTCSVIRLQSLRLKLSRT
jgi:hypothetical protein